MRKVHYIILKTHTIVKTDFYKQKQEKLCILFTVMTGTFSPY